MSSGLLAVDRTLGILPPGALLEIAGTPDCGKTALALWYCRAALQDPAGVVGWVATEAPLGTPSLTWAGIDPARFVFARQSLELPGAAAAVGFLEAGCDLVVIDSLAALLGEVPETPLAILLSRELTRLRRAARETGGVVVMTNQERSIGPGRIVMSAGAGPALLRMVPYRLQMRAGEGLYRGGLLKGHRIHLEIFSAGDDLDRIGRTARCSLYYARGLRDLRTTLTAGG